MSSDSKAPPQQWPPEPVFARRGHQVDNDQQCIDRHVGRKVDQEPLVAEQPPRGSPGSSFLEARQREQFFHGET